MTLLGAGIACLLAGGLLSLLFRSRAGGILYAACSGAALGLIAANVLPSFIGGRTTALLLVIPFPLGEVPLAVDPLSAFFMLVMVLGNFTTALYSIGYVDHAAPRARFYYIGLAILFSSLLGLTVVRQAIAFLFIWEIMSLSSFFLVAYEHDREEARRAAIYYLVAMQAGFAFLLTGFMVLAQAAGSYNFDAFPAVLNNGGALPVVILLLLFVGFGTKAGFAPFHTWLPKAHPAAPAPVSAAMSGVMIKAGIYGLFRFVLIMEAPPLALSLGMIAISIVTALLGVLRAISHRDLKQVLASSSMENIGIIGLGLGLGMLGRSTGQPALALLGILGALLHVLNHSLFKSLLFMGAGSVYRRTHTRDMERLGGLAKSMPITSVLFLVGSLAISGLPLLGGFVGEFALYSGMLIGTHGRWPAAAAVHVLSFASLALIGVLSLFCFVRAYGLTFLGLPRAPRPEPVRETNAPMIAAQIVPAALIVFIGLFPQAVVPLFFPLLSSLLPGAGQTAGASFAAVCSSLSTVFFVFLAIAAAILILRALLLRGGKRIAPAKTWDCGYQSGSGRLQYTAASFSNTVRGFFGPLAGIIRRRKPDTAGTAGTDDVAERLLIRPAARLLRRFLGFFQWVQSGNTQQYILYGIVFLLAVIVLILGLGG